ncbi:hypothetical protein [Burkholderia latens]|uniref:hypothetical protein n=1 Tax=Burkholderia latens TaxID=488446 RepID=UPI0028F43A0B|nr:hypothetical protein [Burkholderia latens]
MERRILLRVDGDTARQQRVSALERLKRSAPCARRESPIDLRDHREMRRPILVQQPEQMFRAAKRAHVRRRVRHTIVDFLLPVLHRFTPEGLSASTEHPMAACYSNERESVGEPDDLFGGLCISVRRPCVARFPGDDALPGLGATCIRQHASLREWLAAWSSEFVSQCVRARNGYATLQ